MQALRCKTGRHESGERWRHRGLYPRAAGAGQDLAAATGAVGGDLQPVPEPDRARTAAAKRRHTPADRQGAADLGRGAVRAGRVPRGQASGSVVREAVLTDQELTERQKQMLIEIYESFRKETLMARAGTASVADDQTGLDPDEAGLVWPDDRRPAAIAGTRRLALAPSNDSADLGTDEDLRDAHSLYWKAEEGDSAEDDSAWPGDEPGPWPAATEDHEGGTIHQFPPQPENR